MKQLLKCFQVNHTWKHFRKQMCQMCTCVQALWCSVAGIFQNSQLNATATLQPEDARGGGGDLWRGRVGGGGSSGLTVGNSDAPPQSPLPLFLLSHGTEVEGTGAEKPVM